MGIRIPFAHEEPFKWGEVLDRMPDEAEIEQIQEECDGGFPPTSDGDFE